MLLSVLFESPAYLRAVIAPAAHAQVSPDETVRFARCVGRELYVFWVPNVTEEQAAAITTACRRIKTWSIEAFTAAVGRALDAKVQRLQ